MTPAHAALCLASLALLTAPPTAAAPEPTPTLTVAGARARLLEEGRRATFRPTTLIERLAVDHIVPALAERAVRGETRVDDLARAAWIARLTVERWTVGADTFLALIEPPGEVRGAGAYVFRVGAGPRIADPPVVLQAPHAYFDHGTGRVAVGMFFGARDGPRARALFVNTVQRYRRGEPDPQSPADVCHRPEHLFTRATLRAVEALGGGRIIQLHGFEDAGVSRDVDVILSAGAKTPAPPALGAAAARVRAVFDGVRLYPDQIDLLGGTTNAQARALAGRAGFVHVELSPAARAALRRSPPLRHRLAAALIGGR